MNRVSAALPRTLASAWRSKAVRRTRGALLLMATLALAPSALAQSPWQLLEDLRTHLEQGGPVTARFEQTYVPAGFSSGDVERGHFSLWLPRCIRWNYTDPQEKSFLLCDGEAFFWNEGESSGRRYQVRAEEEPGYDILTLDTDRLRERYVASSEQLADGSFEISLSQPGSEGLRAKLHLDTEGRRVLAMEHTDVEGNLTRFTLEPLSKLEHTALFREPADLEWIEE